MFCCLTSLYVVVCILRDDWLRTQFQCIYWLLFLQLIVL
jgi:hypothetical protein